MKMRVSRAQRRVGGFNKAHSKFFFSSFPDHLCVICKSKLKKNITKPSTAVSEIRRRPLRVEKELFTFGSLKKLIGKIYFFFSSPGGSAEKDRREGEKVFLSSAEALTYPK